jgi:hypothetical protein
MTVCGRCARIYGGSACPVCEALKMKDEEIARLQEHIEMLRGTADMLSCQ